MQKFKERARLRKAEPYTEIRGSKLNHVLSWPARILVCALAVLLFLGMSNPGQTAVLGRASLSQLAMGGKTAYELQSAGVAELADYYAQANALVAALDTAAGALEAQSGELLSAIGAPTMDKARIESADAVKAMDAAEAALDSTLRAEMNAYEAVLAEHMEVELAALTDAAAMLQLANDALQALAADPENMDLAFALEDAAGTAGFGLEGVANSVVQQKEAHKLLSKALVNYVWAGAADARNEATRLGEILPDMIAAVDAASTDLAEAVEAGSIEDGAAKLDAYAAAALALRELNAAMEAYASADPEAEPVEGEPDYETLKTAYETEKTEVVAALTELSAAVPEMTATNAVYAKLLTEAITPVDTSATTTLERLEPVLTQVNAAFGENQAAMIAANERLLADQAQARNALDSNRAATEAVETAVATTRAILTDAQAAIKSAGDAMKLMTDPRVKNDPVKNAEAQAAIDATVPVANAKLTEVAEALKACAAALRAAKEPSSIAGAQLEAEQTDVLVNCARGLMLAMVVGLVGMVMSLGNNRMRKAGLPLLFLGAGVSAGLLMAIKGAHERIALHVEQLRAAHGLAPVSETLEAAIAKLALDIPDALWVCLIVAILAALSGLLAWVTLPRKTEAYMQIDLLTIFERLTRVLIVVTGLLVFLPNVNPGRVSLLINENASLFTMATSYGTIVEKLENAILHNTITAGTVKLLMAGAAVVVLGIVLNAAGACMSLGNNRMKKKGGYLLPVAGSAAMLAGLFIIFYVYSIFQQVPVAANGADEVQVMFPGGLIFWVVAAAVIFVSSFTAWYLLPDEMEEKMEMEEKYRNFLMFLPILLLTFIFCYLPIWGWRFAFFDYKIGDPLLLHDVVENGAVVQESNYVGLKWFTYLFENPANRDDLVRVLRNTLVMSGLGIATSWLPIAFAVLLAEVRSSKFQRVVQTLTTIPNFISWVLVYAIAFAIFSTDGFINSFLRNVLEISGAKTDYLASADWIWVKMLLWGTWKGLGWSAIVYIAGIAGIDQQLYEAARVDGANRFQCIRHITIPGLVPTYMVMLLMSVAGMLSNGMDQYLVFENAINKDVIEVLDLYVYNIGIKSGLIPLSTVVGVFKSLIGVTLLFGANGISKAIRGESII